MSKKKQLLFFLFATLFIYSATYGQDRTINGVVTTFDSIPLIGAQIKVQSTKQIALSDTLGNFFAICNSDDKLTVTANGFYTQKVKLKDITKFAAINLKLKPGDKNREYAIGYGSVSDKDKINALANVNADDTDFSRYANMYDLIKGRFAGVQVAGGSISIRGTNSVNSGNSALIVVDGVPTSSLDNMSPTQVKNISIIKDAGASIYGTRGANGVIIIETKRN
jgi:TonB-dependent SusC/RagA subfamily outer membrane receptor